MDSLLPLWIATGLSSHPEDHSSLCHLTRGESGRRFAGFDSRW